MLDLKYKVNSKEDIGKNKYIILFERKVSVSTGHPEHLSWPESFWEIFAQNIYLQGKNS